MKFFENDVVENEGIQIELLFCRKVCVLDIFFFFLVWKFEFGGLRRFEKEKRYI